MDIKLELVSSAVCDAVTENLSSINIDLEKVVDTKAINILGQIKNVICNENLDDFQAVDAIVEIFIKNKIDTKSRHDF